MRRKAWGDPRWACQMLQNQAGIQRLLCVLHLGYGLRLRRRFTHWPRGPLFHFPSAVRLRSEQKLFIAFKASRLFRTDIHTLLRIRVHTFWTVGLIPGTRLWFCSLPFFFLNYEGVLCLDFRFWCLNQRCQSWGDCCFSRNIYLVWKPSRSTGTFQVITMFEKPKRRHFWKVLFTCNTWKSPSPMFSSSFYDYYYYCVWHQNIVARAHHLWCISTLLVQVLPWTQRSSLGHITVAQSAPLKMVWGSLFTWNDKTGIFDLILYMCSYLGVCLLLLCRNWMNRFSLLEYSLSFKSHRTGCFISSWGGGVHRGGSHRLGWLLTCFVGCRCLFFFLSKRLILAFFCGTAKNIFCTSFALLLR